MSRLSKVLAAVSVLLFFSPGVVSAKLVGDGTSELRLPQYVKFHAPLGDEAQVDRKVLKKGMLVEEAGDLPVVSKDLPVVEKTRQVPLERLRIVSTSRIIFAPKVSTYIFQSVLNL